MLELEPYSEKNSDLILEWRNSFSVRKNSLNDNIISKKQHAEFLKKISANLNTFYYLVKINRNPYATINFHVKDTDVIWGCNINDGSKIIPGFFPMLIIVAGKYCFEFKKKKILKSIVLNHNYSPQKMNDYLGFSKQFKIINNMEVIEYTLNKSKWQETFVKLRSLLTKGSYSLVTKFDLKKLDV